MDQLRSNRHFPAAPVNIPMDIIEVMLRPLTVRPLSRMRLVSPSWNALITSDRFGRIHRAQMSADNEWVYFFVTESHYRPLQYDGRYIYYRSHRVNGFQENQVDVLCTCSGLAACVTMADDIYLWNPMTTTTFPIAAQPIVCPEFYLPGRVSFCLGQNVDTDDFILVRITIFGGQVNRNEVMVFSRNRNTWTRGPDFPYPTPFLRSGVHVAGILHWLIDMGDEGAAIATLSLESMTYSLMQFEDQFLGQVADSHLDRLGADNLCIFSSLTPRGGTYHLCVLLDYNDQSTWTRIMITLDDSICEIEYHVNLQPLHFVDTERTKILFRVNPVGSFGIFNRNTGLYERAMGGYMGVEGHVSVVRFLQTLERPGLPFI